MLFRSGLEKYLTKYMGVKIKLAISLEQNDKVPYFVSQELLGESGIFQKFFKTIVIQSYDSHIYTDINFYKTGVHVTYQMTLGGMIGSKICDASYDFTSANWQFEEI